LFDQLHCAIERDPRHHFRMSELLPPATHFPDSFVGFFPFRLEEIHECGLHPPVCFICFDPGQVRAIGGIHHLSINIELELLRGGVADANWPRLLIAAEPFHLEFLQAPLAPHAVHDLHLAGAPRHRAQQPFAPCPGLVQIAGAH
jgi:hypothetical protein